MKRKLPIGIQSFEKIRTGSFYYVDKTKYIEKLARESGGYYFLSRPRRFGKSLLIDTIRQAFSGRRELFEGLYLYDNWDWSKRYPVVYISFGAGVHHSIRELEESQRVIIEEHADQYKVKEKYRSVKDRFYELIKGLHRKYNKGVVVLVDEYDKPILDNIEERELAIELREKLKNFYSVLKDGDRYLRLVFLTGVSKFSKVSLFSGLNNLKDITLDPGYGEICGWTGQELQEVFKERLEGIDIKEVKRWYNGYNFLGDKVYNPFDILLFIKNEYLIVL